MSVVLRKIEPTDVPFLYQWENDAQTWADGANHNPLSHQDLRDYVSQTTGDIYKDRQLRLIIETEEEKAGEIVEGRLGERVEGERDQTDEKIGVGGCYTIGCADLFDLDIRNGRAAIGLYIAPEYRGKGYAADVLSQLEQYAFGFLHLRVLYAVISIRNAACNTLFEKSGYTPSTPLKNWTLEGDARIWLKSSGEV